MFVVLFSRRSCPILQIIAACPKPESVKIRDEAIVADKICSIVKNGPGSLQVITDFDATLTRYHLNGNKCDSSYGMRQSEININACLSLTVCYVLFYVGIIANSLPEEYRKIAEGLYKKYYPIEVSPNMTIEDKTPLMYNIVNYVKTVLVS